MQFFAKIALLAIVLFLEGIWLEKQTASQAKSKMVTKITEQTDSSLAIERSLVKATSTHDSMKTESKILQIGRNTNLGF